MIVGGFAAIIYGEPRLTVDVDIVVDMKPEHTGALIRAFPIPEYYINDEEAIRDSLQRNYPFNIIEPTTGTKIDVIPLPPDPFNRASFARRERLEYTPGRAAVFITAEDILIAKLIAHKETGSDKHLRDVRGILITQSGALDMERVLQRARANDVIDPLEKLLDTL